MRAVEILVEKLQEELINLDRIKQQRERLAGEIKLCEAEAAEIRKALDILQETEHETKT